MLPIPRRVLAVLSVLVAAAALAAAGCSGDGPPVVPAPIYSSITITGVDTVLVDDTVVFTAVVLDAGGQVVANPQLTWTSSAVAVATVNNAGTVLGHREGDAIIRAVGGGISSNVEPVAVIQGRGWVDQSDAVNTLLDLHGVHFVRPWEGWIVGAQGTILHTLDAGATWEAQSSFSTGYTLNAVAFATITTGIVVGSAGRILRTTNAGTTWTPLVGVDTDGGRGLNDVYFQDGNRGWIVGNGGLILRTNNGGATWVRVLPGVTANDLERVSFPPNTLFGSPPADPYGRGWIVGGAGVILGSDNFGQSWRIVTPFVTTDPLFGVARRSTAEAIAVGDNNRVAVTAASADTALWSLAPAPTPFSQLAAVAWPASSLPPGSAWAVGRDAPAGQPVVRWSEDRGQSWTAQDLPSTAPLLGNELDDVFFLDDRRGWAVGTQGLVLHTATGGR
jgi:photosystem II stability/assembly factor-like uncharacterized protein